LTLDPIAGLRPCLTVTLHRAVTFPAQCALANALANYTWFHPKQDTSMTEFDRITQQPDMMGGKPCIRGMRVTVGTIVGMIGAGHSFEAILADYPYIEREDILQALRYAALASSNREILLAAE
jgi:uncharacterized protein (DUF433 family)